MERVLQEARHGRQGRPAGKLYLCAIKDAFPNRIVGYCRATTALNHAVARRGQVPGCILHADRGSQFRSRKFVHSLHRHDMVGSMGRVGAAGDNAAMESFVSLLQKNLAAGTPASNSGSPSSPGLNAPPTSGGDRPRSAA